EHGRCIEIGLEGAAVGLLDRRVGRQLCKRAADCYVAARRRPPIDGNDRSAGCRDRGGGGADAGIHDPKGVAPQRGPGDPPRPPAICAARRAAAALLGATSTPASRKVASCRRRSCGSLIVPHTEATNATWRLAAARRASAMAAAMPVAGSACA